MKGAIRSSFGEQAQKQGTKAPLKNQRGLMCFAVWSVLFDGPGVHFTEAVEHVVQA